MDLIKSVSVEAMLMRRDAFMEQAMKAKEAMEQAKEIYLSSGISKGGDDGNVDFEALAQHNFSHFRAQDYSFDEMMKGYDAIAWRYLMRESGLKTFMSSKDIEEWDASIRSKNTPEFTLPNIQATFTKLHAERGNMMDRGILNVFQGLSWDHKTNLPVKFGAKIIIKSYSERVDFGTARMVDDLVRFMHVSDGVPQPDQRHNFAVEFGGKFAYGASAYESDYIDITGFKNGNLHIKFKRLDIVDKMNVILAKAYPNALPSPN